MSTEERETTVRFVTAGGTRQEVQIAPGSTVRMVAESVGENADQLTITVDGVRGTPDTVVSGEENIIGTPKVQGGI